MKKWLKIKLCNWLYKTEINSIYERLEDDLRYEKDRLQKEYAKRRELLELMYADYKRQNEYLLDKLVEKETLNPRSIIMTKDSVN